MTKINYIQIHIGDLIKDTYQLTDEEMGAYMRLIFAYYDKHNDGIPVDRILRIIDGETTPEVLRYFIEKNGKLIHKRCAKEIKKIRAKSKERSKAANKRWENQGVTDNAKAMQLHTKSNANHKPLTNNQEPVKKKVKKKVPKRLTDVTIGDMIRWKKDKGHILHIDMTTELEKCKNHFEGKAKTIGTAYNWMMRAEEYFNNNKGKNNETRTAVEIVNEYYGADNNESIKCLL